MRFLNRLDGSTATYNIPLVVPLGAAADTEALRAALGDLADRHEILRTVLADHDGTPYQRILPAGGPRPPLPTVDCPADEIGAHLAAASRHRFDLTDEPPCGPGCSAPVRTGPCCSSCTTAPPTAGPCGPSPTT